MPAWHREHFQDAIESLYQNASYRRFAGELTVAEAYFHRRAFGRELSHLVRGGKYQFSPAERVLVNMKGKERALYRSEVLDAIVERVLSRWLMAQLSSAWPKQLYSYQPGLSSTSAIRMFAAYVRAHRRQHADPRSRGLWVLRRDIKSYGESIPLDERLWEPLREHLRGNDAKGIGQTLLRSFLPRRFLSDDDPEEVASLRTLEEGTPTGTPIQPAINNFYLLPLDHIALAEPGFYARFGDDFIYACENQKQAILMSQKIDEKLKSLGLRLNPSKKENLYFNGSGYDAKVCGWPSRTSIDLLGASISFHGHIRLRKDKARRLRRSLAARLRSTARSLSSLEPELLVGRLGQTVRAGLTLSHPLVLRDASALWGEVDDRSQIRELDRWLQRLVVELVLHRGIRGFRQLPPHRLYDLGLPSLSAQRNLGRWTHKEEDG